MANENAKENTLFSKENTLSVALVDRFIELQPARTLEVEGFTYIDKDKDVSQFTPPTLSEFRVTTLGSLVELMELGVDRYVTQRVLVHVESYNQASLVDVDQDKFGHRRVYVTATAPKPERLFAFGQYLSQEAFNIALQTMFVPTTELAELIKLAGNLAKELEVRQEDDGFSQRVTVKDGVWKSNETTLKPRMTLKPYRTFNEIVQPDAELIFRVKHDEKLGNLCALFEADGGNWKSIAMQTMQKWLLQRITTSLNADVAQIPVVA